MPAAAATTAHLIDSLCEASGDHTMGAQQLLLLLALYTYGQQAQSALGAHTRVSPPANSRNIAKLGKGEWVMKGGKKVFVPGPGWVESFDDHEDTRNKWVRLTPLGHATIRTAVEAAETQPH